MSTNNTNLRRPRNTFSVVPICKLIRVPQTIVVTCLVALWFACPHLHAADCNSNGMDDTVEVTAGTTPDCNENGIPDDCDIASGTSADLDTNGIPDECLRFVDANATTNGNGQSWETAYRHLQNALAEAATNGLISEIWVSEGVYLPDGGLVTTSGAYMAGSMLRGASFGLLDQVAIYGGFPAGGGDGTFAARDATQYSTVLSGDLANDDVGFGNNQENSLHVAYASGTAASALLDGLTITAGRADNAGSAGSSGAGLRLVSASPTLRSCVFTRNSATGYGAAVYCEDNSDASVSGCLFIDNSATYGAGIDVLNSSPTVADCEFSANVVAKYGAGIYIAGDHPLTISDCVFSQNTASQGGGIRLHDPTQSPTLVVGCTFTGNSANRGGGIITQGAMILQKCDFVDNSGGSGAAIDIEAGNVVAISVRFHGNVGQDYGGAIRNIGSLTVMNSSFSANGVDSASSGVGGGALFNWGRDTPANATVINCTFSGNWTNSYGGAIRNEGTSLIIRNSVFWGNWDVESQGESGQIRDYASTADPKFTLIQGLVPGGPFDTSSNRSTDPFFADADGPDDVPGTADDDLRLLALSPAIDAGDNRAVPLDEHDLDEDNDIAERIPIDLLGQARFVDDPATLDSGVTTTGYPLVVDLGAYEHQPADCNANDIPDVCDIDCGTAGGACGRLQLRPQHRLQYQWPARRVRARLQRQWRGG